MAVVMITFQGLEQQQQLVLVADGLANVKLIEK